MPDLGRRPTAVIAVVASAYGLLYSLGTGRVYPYADDALPFVDRVNNGSSSIVHHLMLDVLAALNSSLGWTGPQHFSKTLFLFKGYVAAMGVMGTVFVGVLAWRWFRSSVAVVLSMLITGCSCGYWSYSIVPDLHVPATALVLLTILCAERSFGGAGANLGWLALAAVAALATSINHQSYSLVTPAIAVVLLLWNRDRRATTLGIRRASFFSLIVVAAAAATYGFAYTHREVHEGFWRYIRGYQAYMQSMPTDRLQLKTPLYMAIGILRALFFPEVVLRFAPVYESASSYFGLKLLGKFRYLVRGVAPMEVVLILFAAGILLCAFVMALWWRRGRLRDLTRHPGFCTLVIWMLLQGGFAVWWLASSREFWIWIAPGVALLVAGIVMPLTTPRGRLWVAAGVAAFVLVNARIVSLCWSESNCVYMTNKEYLTSLRSNDLAITSYIYSIDELHRLLPIVARTIRCPVGNFSFDDSTVSRALREVDERHGRVVLDPMLVMPDETEIRRLQSYEHRTRAAVEDDLRRLEGYCRAHRTPLLAVQRKGAEVLGFRPCSFAGYTLWVDRRRLNGQPRGGP